MMRRAYFGTNSLILFGLHAILIVLDVTGVVPYMRTMFFPMLNFLALMLAILGWKERDKFKTPSKIATVLWIASMIFWIVALVIRMQGV
jgi:hypothetical protein